MKQSFSKSFMVANYSHYLEQELSTCSFMKKEGDVTLLAILDSEIDLKDKLFFVFYNIATEDERERIALSCAEAARVPIFPNHLVWSAKDYRDGKITKEEFLAALVGAADDIYAESNYDDYISAYGGQLLSLLKTFCQPVAGD